LPPTVSYFKSNEIFRFDTVGKVRSDLSEKHKIMTDEYDINIDLFF